MNNAQQPPVIRVENMSKHYGGALAVDRVTVDIHEGEILAVIGDNGAGKSTFVKIISGAVIPDPGTTLYFEGKHVQIKKPDDANKLGIFTVYQDLALCDNLNAVQNIFMGRETLVQRRLDKPAMERRTRNLFDEIGSNVPNPGAPVGTRSGGQRQAVAIARSVLVPPRVILMDEPTAALGVIQRRQVSLLTRQMRSEGKAVVLVSQDLPEVAASADRVLVFRLGAIVAELTGTDINHDNMVAYVTGAVGTEQAASS